MAPTAGQTGSVVLHDDVDPRIERSRTCVLGATAELLREVGYGALTIEAVAARSGVAKSTIYRHWAGKPQLVADAFCLVHDREDLEVPPPGPLKGRVVAMLRDLASATSEADRLACLMPALVDAAERSDEIAAVTSHLAQQRTQPLVDVLAEAVRTGELPSDADPAVLADALSGPIVIARLFHRPPVDPDDVPALVDQILPSADRGRR